MKDINIAENLIAERNVCKRQFMKQIKVIVVLAIIALSLMSATMIAKALFGNKVEKGEAELEKLESRRTALNAELKNYKKTISLYQWNLKLSKNTVEWLDMLDKISSRSPQDTWLIKIQTAGNDNSIEIDGKAANFDSPAFFVRALQSYELFKDSQLTDTRLNGRIVDFSVRIKIAPSIKKDNSKFAIIEEEKS